MLILLVIVFTPIRTPYAKSEFAVELDASYDQGTLSLTYTLLAPEEATWATYLLLTDPLIQVIPLFSAPLPVIDQPFTLPLSFSFPKAGWIGIWSGLFTEADIEVFDLAWVDIRHCDLSNLPDTGAEHCYDETLQIPCPTSDEPYYGQDSQYASNPMSFTDNADGTVSDNVTGLMWQQEDDNQKRDMYAATDYCAALELAGYSDWRLPDISELQGIVDYGRYDPSIDPNYFFGTKSYYYWTSTTSATSVDNAWVGGFLSGATCSLRNKAALYYVRCVR